MKSSSKILFTAMSVILLLTVAVIIRLGVFVFYQQPNFVHFVEEKREAIEHILSLQKFDSIRLEGFWNVKLEKNEMFKVTILATREIYKHISTKLVGKVLHISQGYFTLDSSLKPKLYISMPFLKSFKAKGGSQIILSAFQGKKLLIETKGINEIKCESGRVKNLLLTGIGIINNDMSSCEVFNAKLSLSGFGTVKLNMTGGKLEGQIDRDIKVFYDGSVSERAMRVNVDNEVVEPQKSKKLLQNVGTHLK